LQHQSLLAATEEAILAGVDRARMMTASIPSFAAAVSSTTSAK
jgi:hypothetical protein